MGIRVPAIAALIFVWGGLVPPPAVADPGEQDCGEGLSEAVYTRVKDVRSGSAALEGVLPAFDADAARCPDNAFAQHYAALAHFSRAQQLNQAQAGAPAIFDEVQKAFALSQAYWALPNRDQGFPVFDGFKSLNVGIPPDEPTSLREDMITSLLVLHIKAGQSHAYITGEMTPTCTSANFWDVMAAQGLFTKNAAVGNVMVPFAERVAAACPVGTNGRSAELMHGNLADMQRAYAEDVMETDPELAREELNKVKAFRDAVLEPGETHNYNWHESDQDSLTRLESLLPALVSIPTDQVSPLVSAGSVPVEEWFAEGADGAEVRESIGRTFDAYVATRGSTGFVWAVSKAYVLTKSAPDPKAARLRLYWAAKAYDDGSWRSADTKDRAILDVAYKWLKDYEDEPAADATGNQ